MKLTGVRANFCASHYRDEGGLHGHSYVVWAWFAEGRDAEELLKRLQHALGRFDHSVLPDEYRRSEDLAEAIGLLLGAQRVTVERPVEGIAAEWRPE